MQWCMKLTTLCEKELPPLSPEFKVDRRSPVAVRIMSTTIFFARATLRLGEGGSSFSHGGVSVFNASMLACPCKRSQISGPAKTATQKTTALHKLWITEVLVSDGRGYCCTRSLGSDITAKHCKEGSKRIYAIATGHVFCTLTVHSGPRSVVFCKEKVRVPYF